jgi:hypothetical protein
MVSQEKTVWVNMYENGRGFAYPTEEEANQRYAHSKNPRIQGKAIPFTYEG